MVPYGLRATRRLLRQPGTGLLVLRDANGQVRNINLLIGGENSSGFAALAQFDSNGDGVIDANDPILTQGKVPRTKRDQRGCLGTIC